MRDAAAQLRSLSAAIVGDKQPRLVDLLRCESDENFKDQFFLSGPGAGSYT